MATFRVGIGSFNIQDGAVGFGTDTDGLGNLKVKGVTKTTDIKVSGASTLTRYSGFAADNINQLENITLTSEVGTIGDIVVGVGTSVIISSASTVTVGTVESVSIGTHFSPPVGGIEDRGEDFVEGMMRFNTDLNTMEFYNGHEWRQFTYIADIKNSPSSRGRAVFGGGYDVEGSGVVTALMDFVNIQTLGNATNFGTLNAGGASKGSMGSNGVRGLFMGGYWPAAPSISQQIDYITIASEGNSIDFGNLSTSSGWGAKGASSSTRGIRMGGYPNTDVIDYVEIHSLSNALDFGNLTVTRHSIGVLASPTKIFGGGGNASSTEYSVIDMITTSSKGNAIDDGDLRNKLTAAGAASNSVRGIWAGGSPIKLSNIQYRTLSSAGNVEHFGDLSVGIRDISGASTQTRAIFGGGITPSLLNIIEFVTIASAGNANDFGDLSEARRSTGALSDSHGGLGGF